MRVGVTVSAVGHVSILVLGLVSLSGGEPLQPALAESVMVDLVSVAEFSNMQAGRETSTNLVTAFGLSPIPAASTSKPYCWAVSGAVIAAWKSTGASPASIAPPAAVEVAGT